MKNVELALQLSILDSKISRNQIEIQKWRRKRNQHFLKLRLLQIQQMHLALALEIDHRKIRSYSKDTNFWEIEARNMSDEEFKETFRINRSSFNALCKILENRLTKQDTRLRKCIPLDKRIALALYTLRSSGMYTNIAKRFGIGSSTVCDILRTFLEEIWNEMGSKYIPPIFANEERINECKKEFEELGLTQCLGVIGGLHVEVYPSNNHRNPYENKEGGYSMIVLGLVDNKNRFLYVNIGTPGSFSNSSVYDESRLKQMLSSNNLNCHSKSIDGTKIPLYVVGDSSFTLSKHLMVSYPYSISASDPEILFNANISNCLEMPKKAFEQLKARFGRISKGIGCNIANSIKTIQACCVLHNFLMEQNDEIVTEWVNKLQSFEKYKAELKPFEHFTDIDIQSEEIRNCIANYSYNMNEQNKLKNK